MRARYPKSTRNLESARRPANARYLVDTNVLSELIRKEPDRAMVTKLREHGYELPILLHLPTARSPPLPS